MLYTLLSLYPAALWQATPIGLPLKFKAGIYCLDRQNPSMRDETMKIDHREVSVVSSTAPSRGTRICPTLLGNDSCSHRAAE